MPYADDNPDPNGIISTVHTCFTCCQKAFTVYSAKSENGGPVPDTCPRWRPHFSSLLDCGGCHTARRIIKEAHPSYQMQLQAIRQLWEGFANRVRTGDELATLRAAKEAGSTWAVAATPFAAYYQDLDKDAALRTDSILNRLLPILDADPDLGAAVSELHPDLDWKYDFAQAQWCEAIYLATVRHDGDHEAIAHEFRLIYTDTLGKRAWRSKGADQRLAQFDDWTQAIKAGLDEAAERKKIIDTEEARNSIHVVHNGDTVEDTPDLDLPPGAGPKDPTR
jgi:hypothetical protein